MPQKNQPHLAVRHLHDPLTACLDADGTYICTAYNSRCYIIQKVTPSLSANLNPDADVFESKTKNSEPDSYEMVESDFPPLEGSVYMNGDVGKVPSGAVFTASPEPHPPTPTPEFSLLNGASEVEGSQGLEAFSEGGAGPAAEQPPDPLPPIPLDQLKQMLSSQLEYYFSRENLANDTYLLSQMDNDQYVPIWTVANFNQVKKLTTDIKLITEVLRESPNVQVDDEGQKVRPNHKRCIVILREIPDSTPIEEVKGLFSGKGCPKLISCEFAHNNSWYVTFENDEDAQKAYRFLREEVREFQGKPIMARIKAKPMNRLPLPPGIGGGMGLKNGYRTPPAPASTGPGVFDPSPFSQPAQRYLYSNGSSLPHNVNFPSQVQIYFQQHQPFYPPSMLPTWGPTSPAYFDIGSVFSVNGLAPQGPFTKSHTTRFTPRNSRQKKGGGLEARTSMSDSGILRKPTKETGRFEGQETQRHEDDSCRTPHSKDQALPPRRRRKEDEGGSRAPGSPGPQFDLEADAFPPLPGGQGGAPPEQPPPQPTTHQSPATAPVVAVEPSETRVVVAGPGPSGKSLADKAGPGPVKTEENIGGSNGSVNGDSTPCDQPPVEPKVVAPVIQPAVVETHIPVQQPSQQIELGVVKLSYAQVAQHQKAEREKQAAREQQQQQLQQQMPQPPPPPQQQHPSDDEKKEHSLPPFHYQPKGDSVLGGRGRGGARGAPRRRDNLPRQFNNSRQRSPK
ncbi:la-related protein Larp4B isoform X2 [Halyomorpha halys]|uniref:la-related protein Larp4B isoform X2 n=1 Tax=Halyomorpha halys TaxID=286706 RepID=UPI0006D51ADE|nr:la-related protein CG11505 isoform X2 [Halyomorpha halys]